MSLKQMIEEARQLAASPARDTAEEEPDTSHAALDARQASSQRFGYLKGLGHENSIRPQ
jgi:hypothetical protein